MRRLAQVDIHTITGNRTSWLRKIDFYFYDVYKNFHVLGALKQFLREMPEPLIPNEWAGGLIEMIRAEDWNSWSDHERKVAIIQVF